MLKLYAVLLSLALAVSAQARSLTQEEKLSDLHQLVTRLKSGYGPLQYKRSKMGIDIDILTQEYEKKIIGTQTNGEFYYQIMRYIAEFKDGHFSANLPTTHKASLPFSVDLVRGQVLIDQINRDKLPVEKFPFERGDEIVEFDGRPVHEVVDELEAYVPNGYDLTVRRLAAIYLTYRPGVRTPVPATPEVNVKIRRGDSAVVDEVTLEWTYQGEPIDEFTVTTQPTFLSAKTQRRDFADVSIFQEMSVYQNPQVERSFHCSGSTRIEIPKDATVIMKEPFVAYYYPTPKGNVGYLRIPHYMPTIEDPNSPDAFDLRFAKYEYAVSVLEANTVGLVIDQQHNCGGSVAYLEKILSLFMTQEYHGMQFELMANKEEYLEFRTWTNDRYKDTLDYIDLQKVIQLIRTSWEQGLGMTPKTSIFGRGLLAPNRIHYTKPIVMLIDEMSGSGGDAFPAMMQGYGRAVLIGERTMGLGGHVVEQTPLFYSQIQPRITKSLFYHPNGTPIENNGAAPDVHYQPSRHDFMYGYREFQGFYTDELLKLVP